MDDLKRRTAELQSQIEAAFRQLDIERLSRQLEELKTQSSVADFWDDSGKAQDVMKQIAALEGRVGPWLKVKDEIADLAGMIELGDESLGAELGKKLTEIEAEFAGLKADLRFSGPYDDHDAILSVHAGAGGTDAQDWTQMLFRMYSRYMENNSLKATVIDESAGEEAGLKSVTIEVEGPYAYGKLKGEHGVHRLVRLSPFNSDNLRQTSFSKVEVVPKLDKPEDLEIDDKDLKIDVYRSGGHGGQSVNTTDSAVRVTHLPTGVTVAIQNERSQLQNKETALTILRSRLAQLKMEQHQEKVSELKGPNQSAEWGNQIRSYVLHPYKQVKDLRTKYETSNPDAVLDGDLNSLIDAYLEFSLGDSQ